MYMRYVKTVLVAATCFCLTSLNAVNAGAESNEQIAPTSDQISILQYALHTERVCEIPLSQVWPVFKDMRRWYTEYAFESVSGPPYQEGPGLVEDQVLKVTSSKGFPRASKSDAEGPQPFTMKTIKVIPRSEIVAVLSGNTSDWKRYTQFYVWMLLETGSKTTIVVDTYGEAELTKSLSKREFTVYYDKLAGNWQRSWSEALASLRRLLEAESTLRGRENAQIKCEE